MNKLDEVEIRWQRRQRMAHDAEDRLRRLWRARLKPVRPEQRADYSPPWRLPGEPAWEPQQMRLPLMAREGGESDDEK